MDRCNRVDLFADKVFRWVLVQCRFRVSCLLALHMSSDQLALFVTFVPYFIAHSAAKVTIQLPGVF